MELLFCGTAAAEAWPGLFCTCDVCLKAKAIGGKEMRSRAAYMLGSKIRIDFGPDSNLHQQKFALAYEKLEHLLITHSHDDHWFVHDMAYRQRGFSVISATPLHVWGNAAVEQKFVLVNGSDWERYGLIFHRITAFESFEISDGVLVTPLLGAHDRREECMNYLFEINGRRTLLGHDTGWYDAPTWDYLTDKPIDTLILDCTHGTEDHVPNHLGGTVLGKVRDELATRNALAPDAVCIATHFSHNCGSLHDELETFFTPLGFRVAYDGLRVSI